MNAIEQMMQAFGASSAQSMAAMFGTSAAAESNAVEFASQFAAALKTSEAAVNGVDSPWRLADNPTLATYTATTTDALNGIDGLGVEGLMAPFGGDIRSTFIASLANPGSADQSASTVQEHGENSPAALDSEVYAAFAEGIPGLQLVQLTGLELSSLVENGQLQPLTVDGAVAQPAANDLFLFAASGAAKDGQPVRLIPIAQLEALTMPELKAGPQIMAGGQQALPDIASGTGLSPNIGIVQSTETVQTLTGTAASQPSAAATSQPSAAAAASQPSVTAVAQHSVGAPGADGAASSPEVGAAQTEASGKTLTTNAPSLLQGSSTNGTGQQTLTNSEHAPVKSDAQDAEGHIVQQAKQSKQNQATVAQNAAKAAQNSQAANGPAANGQSTDGQSAQVATQAAAASTAVSKNTAEGKAANSSQGTASSSENALASDKGAAAGPQHNNHQHSAPRRSSGPVTWTPERAAGQTDTSLPAEAMAGGLTGLRGEPSFMNSMGLMGGRPSPVFGAHVAKQVNLQISKAVKNGNSEFNLRLNPTELGSIKVKMSFTDAGRVSAQVFVERPETLELLQREMRGMERAMEAGGHKVEQGGLTFNLDTGDGESAGKAFADAVQQDKHKEQMEGGKAGEKSLSEDFDEPDDLTDLATLEQILSRVSPETGLDVRV